MATNVTDELLQNLQNPDGTTIINHRCLLRTQDGHRVVLVSGIVLAQYSVGDRMAEANAMVGLVEQGWANQNEVARAFHCSARTVRRDQRRFEDGGLAALGQPRGFPKGRHRLRRSRTQLVQRLKAKGRSNRQIARCLGVSPMAIRKLLRRLGWKESASPQPDLFGLETDSGGNPNLSAFATAAPVVPSRDTDATDRRGDRLSACLGLLDDAAPLFGSRTAVPRAGVLLAVPALVQSGIFECAQKIYGSLGPAFYGLRTSLLTLLLMALWRIKRPEGLKEHPPQALGQVLGLDRVPEVKTLRRKLASGDPLLVITAEANAGLVKMLPVVLAQVRALVGERRLTVVFDRGGYSPKLFLQILDANFDLLTYRKGRLPRIRKRFRKYRTHQDGRTFTYALADQEVRLLKGKLRLRQVTRLAEDGHQTPILTSRRDLPPAQVAYWMFGRWRQENFFKYLREEYALDALVEYAAVPDDANREVPNPAWAAVDAQLQQARAYLDRLQSEYGLEALTNPELKRPTMRGFKIAQGKLSQQIWNAMQRASQLEARRAAIPRRVPVQAVTEEPVVKLAPERKHLTNLIKMVAYQAESDLLRTVAPHYRRVEDEGRTLIQSALASAADLQVTEKELRVTLLPQSSPHRTRAIAALCEELNGLDTLDTIFPGSQLRLRYAIWQTA